MQRYRAGSGAQKPAVSWLRDKAATAVALTNSDVQVHVVKATNHVEGAPKEKHVAAVLQAFRSLQNPDKVMDYVIKRLKEKDWVVVLKACCLYHRMMRDGPPEVIEYAVRNTHNFNLQSYTDVSSPQALAFSSFIRSYSIYLEEKVFVYKDFRRDFDHDDVARDLFTRMNNQDLMMTLPKLSRQLETLLAVRAEGQAGQSPSVVYAFSLLLQDCFRLYRVLNDGVLKLLEEFFLLPKRQAYEAFEVYSNFQHLAESIIPWCEKAKELRADFHFAIPEFKAPQSLVQSLKGHLQDLEKGVTGRAPQSDDNIPQLTETLDDSSPVPESRIQKLSAPPLASSSAAAPAVNDSAPSLISFDDGPSSPQQRQQRPSNGDLMSNDLMNFAAPPPPQNQPQQQQQPWSGGMVQPQQQPMGMSQPMGMGGMQQQQQRPPMGMGMGQQMGGGMMGGMQQQQQRPPMGMGMGQQMGGGMMGGMQHQQQRPPMGMGMGQQMGGGMMGGMQHQQQTPPMGMGMGQQMGGGMMGGMQHQQQTPPMGMGMGQQMGGGMMGGGMMGGGMQQQQRPPSQFNAPPNSNPFA